MKVLGLHGKQQNANVFITRTGKLINKARKCNLVSDFVCIDGPHELPLRTGDEVPMRAWYTRSRNGIIDQSSLEEALVQIENVWKQKGPFDGLLAFSMGGAMAAIVASMPHRFPGIRFVILAGAPDIDDPPSGAPMILPFPLRSLHMIGMEDRAVPPTSSRALAARFSSPRIVEHELGHCIPMKAVHIQVFMDFLQEVQASPPTLPIAVGTSPTHLTAGSNNTVTQTPALQSKNATQIYVCSSDDIAALQSEEAEVLGSIYPNELSLLPPDSSSWPQSASVLPSKAGDPCVAFHIELSLDPELFEPSASAGFPLQWVGNIGLLFHLPGDYPISTAPIVSVTTGKLTLSDGFSDAKIESLERAIQSAVVPGEAAALVCIQAASDWFSTGQWRAAFAPSNLGKGESGDCAAVADEAADEAESDSEALGSNSSCSPILAAADEAEEADHIRVATAEACEVACRMRQLYGHLGLEKKCPTSVGSAAGKQGEKSCGGKDQPVALLPPSARGVWSYTVGLVGKPSAGKSTFYNAVTRAALERGGRLLAEVAPHPFTTIEPNIGPGWYASFEQDGEYADVHSDKVKAADLDVLDKEQYRRRPLHGRCCTAGALMHRRLLPVVVKDVAGLVPGAYKGRGKGNRFLADLCDADVLVHVVDVTGKSDRDGNAVITEVAETAPTSSVDKQSSDRGSTPMEDAEWIREELHRWIYGNVRGKWNSVVHTTRIKGVSPVVTQTQRDRCAQRVLALFTGYQGPRWCVERAAERAGLELDKASLWGALDLHRMVAHFLCIRFPVCLALNKIDALGCSEEELMVIEHCQEAARLKGEVAVPVSARAECFVLNNMAAASVQAGAGELSAALRKGTSAQEAAIHADVIRRYGTSGVLETISAAVLLKPPVLCYPVCDLDSECPVGWTSGKVCVTPGSSSCMLPHPRLQDCLQMKPGSTVGDVFEALKRGELGGSAGILQGDFVRADSRPLGSSRVLQLRRDAVLEAATAVLRIQTNRKSVWQSSASPSATKQ